ncbi:hypothetical protein F2P81_009267 [Scophthalmus maximus]|uniref:Uncharacterized protein n=1 Tax=Scophthalmus maximus TaxID=52904 RepID=A0A6A4SYA5_SCOMX|nr:hypothetical protein F2P81_009267 [Scophthalmus maximus]
MTRKGPVLLHGPNSARLVSSDAQVRKCFVKHSTDTDECRSFYPNNHVIKFSDDTAISSLSKKNYDPSDYFMENQRFVNWCDDNHLVLNVNKTDETVFDPRGVGAHSPVVIHNKNHHSGPLIRISWCLHRRVTSLEHTC